MAQVSILPNSRNLPNRLNIEDKAAHGGGEGNLYFTTDERYAVKIYHSAPSDKQDMLQKIIDLGRNLGEDERLLAWPLGIVNQVNSKAQMGVVTRFIPYSGVQKG